MPKNAKPIKKLKLSKSTLQELEKKELRAVLGGGNPTTWPGPPPPKPPGGY
jgi:natural product precursor